VFCGTAAGGRSASAGHYYANPSNRFWEFLFRSGLTPELLVPKRDHELPHFGFGLTDLVKRRSAATDDLLARSDFDVPDFARKMRSYRPSLIAFHGKGAAREARWSVGGVRRSADLMLGPQTWSIEDIPVFVLPSASASNQGPRGYEGRSSRLDWFMDLAALVEREPHDPRRRQGLP
jgi:TDG/mug DNA glycosylase family protein